MGWRTRSLLMMISMKRGSTAQRVLLRIGWDANFYVGWVGDEELMDWARMPLEEVKVVA